MVSTGELHPDMHPLLLPLQLGNVQNHPDSMVEVHEILFVLLLGRGRLRITHVVGSLGFGLGTQSI